MAPEKGNNAPSHGDRIPEKRDKIPMQRDSVEEKGEKFSGQPDKIQSKRDQRSSYRRGLAGCKNKPSLWGKLSWNNILSAPTLAKQHELLFFHRHRLAGWCRRIGSALASARVFWKECKHSTCVITAKSIRQERYVSGRHPKDFREVRLVQLKHQNVHAG